MKTRWYFEADIFRALSLWVILMLARALSPAASSQVVARSEVYELMPVGAIALQPDGRILLADGYGLSLRFVNERTGVFGRIPGGVFRLRPDGVVDRTFQTPLKPITGATTWNRGLVLQPDGAVLTIMPGQPLVRLSPTGGLDSAFALDSVQGPTAAAWSRANALRQVGLGSNGEFFIASSSLEEPPAITGVSFEKPAPGIQRFSADGHFLPSTTRESNDQMEGYLTAAGVVPLMRHNYPDNRGGELVIYQPSPQQLPGPLLGQVLQRLSDRVPLCLWRGALRLADGRMIVAVADSGSQSCGRLLRLRADWQLDTGFSSRFELGGLPYCLQLAEGPNDSLLVVGTLVALNGEPFTGVARLTPEGSTDRSFRVCLEDQHAPVALAIAVQTDARVLIGGLFTAVNGIPCTYFARLNPDGTVDEPFSRRFSRDAYMDASHRLKAARLELAGVVPPTGSSDVATLKMEDISEVIWISAILVQESVVIIEMKGKPNTTYVLQATDALASGDWVVVATSVTDKAGAASFRDTSSSEAPLRVYRICSVR